MNLRGKIAAVGAFAVAFGLAVSAHAQVPGQVFYTYYDTTNPFVPAGNTTAVNPDQTFNEGGNGDNIIRLVNPNGAANGELVGALEQPVCAMIYVFDDDEEMGECCGCPLTSAQLATFSVNNNLLTDWGISGGPEAGFHGQGSLAIVAASLNPSLLASNQSGNNGHFCSSTQSGACNFGCDPTNNPGYEVTTANNILGSMTHNQIVAGSTSSIRITNITETALFDDCHGNAGNLVYLQQQCGSLIGNGSGGGICNCPTE
jgi:hypothetical protein